VLAYLGRYTHRVALANSRLTRLADGQVDFTWKDYRQHGKTKVMTLVSMPIEYSPKVPTENSSLRYGSIAAVATRRLDIGEDIKIEIGDGVQGLGSGAVAEAVWQGVAPGGVFGL
jgi:Putative transposase